MKRFLLSLGLIAMAFNLTNCAKYEEVTPAIEAKGDFAIYAPITRTVNNDMNTSWVAKDEINLFHAVGETADYVNDTPYLNNAGSPFVCENAAEGYFLGSLYGTLDLEEEYDWYAFYPYSSYIKTPANDNSGYTNIGSKAGSAQVQNGNNSMAHIAGTNYPMAGYAVAVPGGQQPTLEFKHISSLIEFEVVNKLTEAITVTEIQFTAEEDIVGSFYINFAKPEAMKFTSSGAGYTSNTAILSVTGGAEIAPNASAKFYAAVKPFTAKAGSDLTVKVSAISNTGLGAHEKDLTLSSDVVFASGNLKNVKVDYTTAIEAVEAELYELVTSLDDITAGTYVVICGNYVLLNNSGSSKQTVTTYASKAITIASGSISCAVPEECKWSFVGDNTAMALSPINNTKNYLYSTKSGDGLRIGTTNDTWSFKKGATANCFYLMDKNASTHLAVYNNQDWRSYTSATQAESNMSLYKLYDPNAVLAPVLTLGKDTIDAEPDGGTFTIEYTLKNPVSGVSVEATTAASWIEDFDLSVDGQISFVVTKNETSEARTAVINVTYGDITKSVTVNQTAAGAKVWTLVTDASTLAAGDQVIIAAKNDAVAMSTTQNSNNRGQEAITKSGNTLATPSSKVQIFTLKAGKNAGTFAFYTGAGYIYAASSSKNYLKTETSLSANSSWTVTITSAGVATVKAQGTNTKNWLRHNSQSSLFSCYSSGQNEIVIYKLQ
ncbi:MAG: BACON domain-containing protein [Alistipes sp.]|nr:BACON domain-containing protein [Alistipes sp.]